MRPVLRSRPVRRTLGASVQPPASPIGAPESALSNDAAAVLSVAPPPPPAESEPVFDHPPVGPWTLQSAINALKTVATDEAAASLASQGVQPPLIGVPPGDLARLARSIGVNRQLAAELWASGIHDARVLSTLVSDPAQWSTVELEIMATQAHNAPLGDALAAMVARRADALSFAQTWSDDDGEFTARAGAMVLSSMLHRGNEPEHDVLRAYLRLIERRINAAPPGAREGLNLALISIGGRVPALRADAIATAHEIGRVTADGAPSGRTLDAVIEISRLAERRAESPAAT